MISVTTFACKRDDLTIRGTEYRPQGENLPIAIVSHGFMAFQDTVRHYAKKLAELGYVSYCFDFCGGCVVKGKSDGKTTEMSVMTEVKDLEAVIDYARNRQYSNPQKIVLMGCSQGGFVSAIAASRLGNQISKLILFYPALCIPDDARAGKMMFAKFDPHNLPDIIPCGPMKLGKCYVEDVIHLDPCQEISKFQGDVLIIHGTKDKIVNVEYAKQAYSTYSEETKRNNLARAVSFYEIKNGAHGFSKKHDAIAIDYLEQFLTMKPLILY
ncbi:MAG: lysophospholipase [Lachnospiraceae bacterium]|nr:lysophospholipase [Lachnospiraceae bacterium]